MFISKVSKKLSKGDILMMKEIPKMNVKTPLLSSKSHPVTQPEVDNAKQTPLPNLLSDNLTDMFVVYISGIN